MATIHRVPLGVTIPLTHLAVEYNWRPHWLIAVSSADTTIHSLQELYAAEYPRRLSISEDELFSVLSGREHHARYCKLRDACGELALYLEEAATLKEGLLAYYGVLQPSWAGRATQSTMWVRMVDRWTQLTDPETVKWTEYTYRWPLEVVW